VELADLKDLAARARQARKPVAIRCCTASNCLAKNSRDVAEALRQAVSAADAGDRVEVCEVGCMRLCSEGPLVAAEPRHTLYEQVTPADAAGIVAAVDGGLEVPRRGDWDRPFFRLQRPLVLESCGTVEPERIESALAVGAYQSLYRALHELTPAEVITAVTKSGLRGRGGAGYPTGVKWSQVARMTRGRGYPAGQKYVVCNADEGDPGAFMDRAILESDPHRVLEGMAIAAYAVGASQGYVYVRGEYPLATRRLEIALRQARQLGLLGTQVFGSPFDLRIDIRVGAGAYVCGEETALMASIEGGRGTPRPRPPYPAESGLWGCPTLINNVETFANVPVIVRDGADRFAAIGTETSKGTKVFAISGHVRYSGLIEVAMGTPLRRIVEEIGGASAVKAVQTGGPSGGCIPAAELDTPVDYESLGKLGSIMGSGGMVVLGPDADMVDLARYFMHFCMEESCGKCIPCRAGTVQMHGLLTRLRDGDATADDLGRLEALCDMVKHTSLCGLGQSAPNPVLSTLRFFREEYTQRLRPPRHGGRVPLPVT
jgi:bidirectional [NiFe] hydrogenase diaphorase subunit